MNVNSGAKPSPSGSVESVRPLEVDEVLQHRLAERRELDDDAGRQTAGIEREVAATEARRAAERGGDVPHRGEVPHLLDRHLEDRRGASARRRRLRRRAAPPRCPLLQAERRVEIRAHQVVLELGGLVELVHQRFARHY